MWQSRNTVVWGLIDSFDLRADTQPTKNNIGTIFCECECASVPQKNPKQSSKIQNAKEINNGVTRVVQLLQT